MSFFSRKRHTPQPAPAAAPAPAAPSPPVRAPGPTRMPPGAFPHQQQQSPQQPPQQSSQQLPQQPPQQPPQQQQPPLQQQQQHSTPQQQSQSRPRQDYPWSVRRLLVDAPQKLPPNAAANGLPSVTGMQGPLLPRYGHSVPLQATPTGELFIFGGLVKEEVKDDLWVLSGFWNADAVVNSNGRRSTKEMGVKAALIETTGDAPGPRVGHKSALVSSVLIVWGGDTLAKDGDRNDDGLYLLNLSTRDWTRVSVVGPKPLGRYGHAVGMCGNKFVMFGGQVDGEFLNDLWSFDLQSLVRGNSQWEQLTPAPGNEPPPRRTGHVLVTYENKIYIFGGTDGAFHYNDTWVFDLATRTWTELTCIGFIPVPREGHAAALVGDVMYIFGGRGVDGKDLGDLGSFKIGNQRWYMFQNMGPQPSGRSGHAMATADGRMFVLGGESGDNGGAAPKDDALLVHVLDTNLIKYPESKGPVPQNKPPARAQNGTSPAPARPRTDESGDEGRSGDESRRAAPRARTPNGGVPPPRPPRRSEDDATRSSHDVERARSPPEPERARSPPDLDRTRSPTETKPTSLSAVALRTAGSRSTSPADGLLANGPGHVRAGSAISIKQDEIESYRRREAWMRAALARAVAAGFVWADQPDLQADGSSELGEVVLGLQQNQARLRLALSTQIQAASDRMAEADRIKTAAAQEAAFYRAKLAAYESGLDAEANKVERERLAHLERLLAAAATERTSLERVLLERTEALALQTQLCEQAQTQTAESLRRAEMAEEAKDRVLAEHADLLDRNVYLESSVRDHSEKFFNVQSSSEQQEVEHAAVLQKLDEALALRDEHVRTLQQTQEALAATSARADDLEKQWERSREMISALEVEVADTRAELEARNLEAQSATRRLEDVENAWAKSREEADKLRQATTSSLGVLLDSHREMRADEDRASRGHAEKVHAMEMEVSSLRKMLTEAGNRIGESQADAVGRQKQLGAVQADAAALRVQLGGVRAQLAASVAEQGRLKHELSMKENAVRERASAASLAEVRLGMLRNYLVDNGLVINEEEISSEGEGGRAGIVRIQQLENELRERARLHQDTERELMDVQRRKEDTEAKVQHLAQQLERAKSATSPSPTLLDPDSRAERRREETETRLNKRIQELDHDYQMAVKYVKGTEKMMRRMKEDYAKSKALNEKLQTELDTSRGITSSEAGSRTRGATGRNTPQSDEGHEPLRGQLVDAQRQLQRITGERNDLRRQVESLQQELEQFREDLVISQNEISEKEGQIEELEARIRELDHSLSMARGGADESAVDRLKSENAALRREKDLLSHKVHILLDDQGGYATDGRPISGISRRESQASTENGMTQFDSFEDWQQRVNSRTSTAHRESDYEPSTSRRPNA